MIQGEKRFSSNFYFPSIPRKTVIWKKNMTNIRTHDLSSILFFLLICFFVCLLRERVIRVMFLIYDQITRAATTHRIRIKKLENESSCVVCIDCNIIVISGENVLLEKNLPRKISIIFQCYIYIEELCFNDSRREA